MKSCYVSKDSIKPFDSEKIKIEALKKVKSSPVMSKELPIAIADASKEIQLFIIGTDQIGINGIVSPTLPSMDEELSIIKGKNFQKDNRSESMDTMSNDSTRMNTREVNLKFFN